MTAIGALAFAVLTLSSAQIEPARERTPVLRDWEDLKYGMFIHYGMSTFTGDEYGGTPAEAKAYNPTKLDVDQWIRTAKAAGMKYAVLTTKHCYGHALWPTKASDYGVSSSSEKTDVVRAFVDACRKHGIKPGFYYLLGWDSHHQPKMTPAQYEAFCRKQVTELLTGYGPILEMWFDIPWDMGPENGRVLKDLYALVKRLQPDCLVLLNQSFTDGTSVRWQEPSYAGKATGLPAVPAWPKDIIDGEVTPPPAAGHNPHLNFQGVDYYIPMETCDTMTRHWFWLDYDAIHTVPTLYRLYQSTVGRNANLLLDAGPDRTGRLTAGTVRRLMELAAVIRDPSKCPVNLLAGKPAKASNVYAGDPAYGADKLTDADPVSRWATDNSVRSAWVEIDLGKETEFDSAVVTEGWNRVRSFAIEVPDGAGWKAITKGGKMGGDGKLLRFKRVKASKVRLSIVDSKGGPTIWDFEVYDSRRSGANGVKSRP